MKVDAPQDPTDDVRAFKLGIAMALYVHVTDDEKAKEVQNMAKVLKII